MLALTLLAAFDLSREPQNQFLSHAYVGLVDVYRAVKGVVGLRPRCRFRPSCSQYSVQAVERHGLIKGLGLTYGRVIRCKPSVPWGSPDPVP